MSDWHARLRAHLGHASADLSDEVIDELADHLEDAWDASGRAEASDADADAFVARTLQREDFVELRRPRPAPASAPEPGGASLFSALGGELRFATRLLRRTPIFTVSVIGVLALGIAATTAAFSLVHAALLAPLPYLDADRLVMVWEHNLPRNRARNVINPGNYFAWSERSQSFEATGLLTPTVANLTGVGDPEELRGVAVGANVLTMVGARPLIGRLFQAGEDDAGAARTALISEGLWRRRFGGAPDAVGRTVSLGGQPTTIVGVLPAGYALVGFTGDYWRPVVITPEARTNFRGRSLMSMAKLKPGVTPEAAQQELASVFAGLVTEHPEFNTGWSVNVVPLRDQLTSEIRPALWTLFGAVVAVLLIACANVAALLLVRAAGRRHEMALKAALGARTGHLARQLFIETALLVGAGGVLGVALAGALKRVVVAGAQDAGVPLVTDTALGGWALVFALAVTTLTALACGLGPALGARAATLGHALREGGRGAVGGQQRLRGWLVAGEVAAAMLLLSGAGLLARSYLTLQSVDPGFSAEQVLTARVSRSNTGGAPDASVRFANDVIARLAALPGVSAAAATVFLPLDGSMGIGSSFLLADRPPPAVGDSPVADYRPVTPGYFGTLRIPVRQGRDFADADRPDRPRVAIVNEAFVRRYSADVSPIGRRLNDSLGESQEIVGVVGDVKLTSLDGDIRPAIYLPLAQLPLGSMTFVMRASGPADALGRAVVAAIHDLDPNQPVSDVRLLDEVVTRSLTRPRVASAALGLFAALALLLAALGVYGVVAYGVSQRRAEFGVRLALGAQPGDVVWLVLRQSMGMVVGGVVLGAALAIPASAALRSLLFGVRPGDPVTLASVAALLVAAGCLASYVPARRGTRVDPVSALRSE